MKRTRSNLRARASACRYLALCLFACLIGLAAGLRGTAPAAAYPMFTRKYNLPCERCHTMPSRLTPFGYAFYRAGFRLPSNEVKPFQFFDAVTFGTRLTSRNVTSSGDYTLFLDGLETNLADSVSKTLAVRAQDFIAASSRTNAGVGELWAQYNSAPAGTFWSVRAGQIPILDGYNLLGARNITLNKPILLGPLGPLTGTGQGNFALANLERGIEVGYTHAGFSARASWLNGFPNRLAGAGVLTRDSSDNFALQTEYLIGNEGSAVGGFLYRGTTRLVASDLDNSFGRAGIFGTWARAVGPGTGGVPDFLLEVSAGGLWGDDTMDVNGTRASSYGGLLELDLHARNRTSYIVRYDMARRSDVTDTPTGEAWTFAFAHRPNNFVRFQLEYRKARHPDSDTITALARFFY